MPSARARCTSRSCSSVESSIVIVCHCWGMSSIGNRARSSALSTTGSSADASMSRVVGDRRRDGGRGAARPSGARGNRDAAALVGLGDGAGAFVGGLVERMADMALDPFEPVSAAHERLVELLQELEVHHGLAVCLAPALALPPGHPLRHRVDDVLAVAEHEELVVDVRRRAEELEHRLQLAHVVGRVLPSAGRPAVVVDVPRPAGRAGVSEGRTVGGGDDHAGSLLGLTCGANRIGRRRRMLQPGAVGRPSCHPRAGVSEAARRLVG